MMRRLRWQALAAAACLWTACGAAAQDAGIRPFSAGPERATLQPEELRIWEEAGNFDRTLRRRGALLGNAELDAYLQDLLDTLFPEFKGTIRVRTVSDPDLNAFALPNGSIYINLGMLARLENEAQLVAVLAHEGAHFVHRHGHQHVQNAKAGSAFALGLTLVGQAAGVGGLANLLGQVAAYSSIYGFSRELEREADRVGFERMVAVGYDPAEAARPFEILRDEAKLLDIKEAVMFASHPKLEERIESFRELKAKAPTTDSPQRKEEERFLAATRDARQLWLRQAFGFSRYKSVIHVLEQPGAASRFPPQYRFYLGEAYRLRNEKEDADKAMAAFQGAIEAVPQYARSYKSLGLMHMHAERKDEARAMFEKYLALQPAAEDAAFVKTYLQQIQ